MATEEAKIVVTIDRGTFKSGLRGMEGEVAASGKRMKSSLSGAFSAGLGSAKNTIKGMFSGIGQHMKTMATFGGAIGAGVLVRDALHLQTLYRNIAYNVSKIPGQAMKWQDVQALVSKTVEKTGQKAEDLASAFDFVFKETGRLDVAKGVLESIGTMATATGKSTETFAEISRLAFEKFGVTLERLPDAMSGFESLIDRGGKNADELGRKFGLMAGAAADAGFTGEEGMKALLNMLTAVDDAVGERPEAALKNMMAALRGGGTKGPSEVEKRLGHRFEKGEGLRERMGDVLSAGGKARSAFETKLTAEGLAAFNKMAPIFDGAMKKALEEGKDKREAAVIALDKFNKTVYGADIATRSFADNQKEAADRLKDDPSLQLQKAMNKLQEVMTSPEALASIKKLMDVLPPLAEKMAALLEWIISNPIMAGGAAIGGRIGASYMGGVASDMSKNLFRGTPGVAPDAAPSAAGRSFGELGISPAKMESMGNGKMLITPGTGWPMVPPSADKMKMTGSQIAGGISSAVAALGVGVAIGTAISSVLQTAADEIINRQNSSMQRYDQMRFDMANLGKIDTPEKAAAAKKILENTKKAVEYDAERYKGVGGGANILKDTAGAIFGSGDSPFTVMKQNADRQKAIMSELSASLKPTTDSVDRFAKALDKIGKGEPRGPVTKSAPTPGATPKK